MNNPKDEGFGIERSTLLVVAVAITFGSFSVYKALGVSQTERSEVTAVTASVSGTALSAGVDVTVPNTNPLASATRLTNAPRPDVKTILTPIEQIQVGDRVLAESPTGEEDTTFGSEIIPADWRKLTLRAPKRDGTVADVVLLRPLTWLTVQHGEVGGTVFISVPECGIDGNANVLAIDPCPEIPKVAVSLREMSLDLSRRFKSATGCLPDSMEAQQDSLARSSGPVHTARHVSAERDWFAPQTLVHVI